MLNRLLSLLVFLILSGCAPGSLYHVSCSHPSHPDNYWCSEFNSQRKALDALEDHKAEHGPGWDGMTRGTGPCPYGKSEE